MAGRHSRLFGVEEHIDPVEGLHTGPVAGPRIVLAVVVHRIDLEGDLEAHHIDLGGDLEAHHIDPAVADDTVQGEEHNPVVGAGRYIDLEAGRTGLEEARRNLAGAGNRRTVDAAWVVESNLGVEVFDTVVVRNLGEDLLGDISINPSLAPSHGT